MLLQSLKELIRYAGEYESEFVEKVIVYEREPGKSAEGYDLKSSITALAKSKLQNHQRKRRKGKRHSRRIDYAVS